METGNGNCEFDSAVTTDMNCYDFYVNCKGLFAKGIHDKTKIIEDFRKFFLNRAGNATGSHSLGSCTDKNEDDGCRFISNGKWARCYCSTDLCDDKVEIDEVKNEKVKMTSNCVILISFLSLYAIVVNVM